ncbi:acyl-CoA N-acyltransferase [Blastocladiella britannica]|nr:acyl-CoA N-acyltransferase [Blastocladiella britannica]
MDAPSLPPEQQQEQPEIAFDDYAGEHELPNIMAMIEAELSEPYSIYTFRYFTSPWPKLTILCRDQADQRMIGVVVAKVDVRPKDGTRRGYIGMLAVDRGYRRHGLGSRLVQRVIERMRDDGCDEIVLEADATNAAALRLYERLGFLRDKRLTRYYLTGHDAFRLKLWLNPHGESED